MKIAIVLFATIVGVFGLPNIYNTGRVVGGEDAEPGQFPFIISLRYYGSHNCGGSIIAPTWIVTAAHCVDGYPAESLTVVAGSNKLSGGKTYKVKRAMAHEDYSPYVPGNDIGLIELQEAIDLKETNTKSINIKNQFIEKGDVTLAGWGRIYAGGPIPENLQFIDLRVISNEDCAKDIDIDFEQEICTKTKEGEGACNGDSGGPLIYEGQLAGLVSRGYPCALNMADVYTRPYAYCDWIAKTTNNAAVCKN